MYTTENLHLRLSPGSREARNDEDEWEEMVSNTHLPMSVRPGPQPGGGRFSGASSASHSATSLWSTARAEPARDHEADPASSRVTTTMWA
jgi:hypothetical protein